MHKVLTDPGLREDLIPRGFTQANKFSWQKAALQVLELHEAVDAA